MSSPKRQKAEKVSEGSEEDFNSNSNDDEFGSGSGSVNQRAAPSLRHQGQGHSKRRNNKKRDHEEASNSDITGDQDLTTVEGQLKNNPRLSLEDAKFRAKREYHRQNAARARIRNKQMVEGLQGQVTTLTRRAETLERENEILKAQLTVLLSQQQQQQQQQQSTPQPAPAPVQQVSASTQLQQQNDITNSIMSLLQGGGGNAMPAQQQQQQQQQPQQQSSMSSNQDTHVLSQLLNGRGSQQQEQNLSNTIQLLLGNNQSSLPPPVPASATSHQSTTTSPRTNMGGAYTSNGNGQQQQDAPSMNGNNNINMYGSQGLLDCSAASSGKGNDATVEQLLNQIPPQLLYSLLSNQNAAPQNNPN